MANEKVLVIEDRRENLVFLANQILRPNGYEVSTAGDGKTGLDKALAESPDLIIMDFRMPKMTGIEVLHALHDAGKDIPVIMTTFHGSEELAIEAFRLGARDYLIKPYEVEQMIESIDRALAPRRRYQEETSKLKDDVTEAQKALENRVRELHILSGIGKAVTSILNVETILQRIVEAASFLTGAEEAFLMLVDEDSGELHMRAAKGMGRKYTRFKQKVDDSIAGQVVRTGKPVRIGQTRGKKSHEVMTGYLVRDLLNVPLKVRGKVIGVLGVDNTVPKGGFSENDEYLLATLADYAAIALDNASLYELMEARAEELTMLLTSQQKAPPKPEPSNAQQEQLREHQEQLRGHHEKIARIGEQLSSLAMQLNAAMVEIDEIGKGD